MTVQVMARIYCSGGFRLWWKNCPVHFPPRPSRSAQHRRESRASMRETLTLLPGRGRRLGFAAHRRRPVTDAWLDRLCRSLVHRARSETCSATGGSTCTIEGERYPDDEFGRGTWSPDVVVTRSSRLACLPHVSRSSGTVGARFAAYMDGLWSTRRFAGALIKPVPARNQRRHGRARRRPRRGWPDRFTRRLPLPSGATREKAVGAISKSTTTSETTSIACFSTTRWRTPAVYFEERDVDHDARRIRGQVRAALPRSWQLSPDRSSSSRSARGGAASPSMQPRTYGCRVTTTTISDELSTSYARQRGRRSEASRSSCPSSKSDYRDLDGRLRQARLDRDDRSGRRSVTTTHSSRAMQLDCSEAARHHGPSIDHHSWTRSTSAIGTKSTSSNATSFPGSCIPSVTALSRTRWTRSSDLRLFDLEDITRALRHDTAVVGGEAFLEQLRSIACAS